MRSLLLALALVAALPAAAVAQPAVPPGAAPVAPHARPDLVVIARLVAEPPPPGGCGTFHFASVMRYEVVRVLSGHYTPRVLYAAHGCVEMTRQMYGGPGAGALTRFTPGELHRLELRRAFPTGPAGPSLIELPRAPAEAALPRFWTVRADPAP